MSRQVREYSVTLLPDGKRVRVPEGTTLFEAIRRGGLIFNAPCGGSGTCGKCMVHVANGPTTVPVFSCRTEVRGDITVVLPREGEHHILTTSVRMNLEVEPLLRRVSVAFRHSEPRDRRSEWDRLKDACGMTDAPVNIPLAACLPDRLSELGDYAEAVIFGNEILDVRPPGRRLCAIAFDLGTTTVVGWLLDGQTGETIAVSSMLNPQVLFGADVITRANYVLSGGKAALADSARAALNNLTEAAAATAGVSKDDIYLAVVVGNTCMHHLFLGLSPASLVLAPYRPVVTEPLILDAEQYLKINASGRIFTLPNIAGFVGSDTVGVMIATGLDRVDELTLAIDIGTNGELVLADGHRIKTCSTAAGPAFEGAKISCGMRGTTGAVDHVRFDGEDFHASVIGGGVPKGICGSGLMDLVAGLLDAEIIDPTGRLSQSENQAFSKRFATIEDQPAFAISDGVYLTQRDVREVQLAKAAMAAGIKLLIRSMDAEIEDVRTVLIAGAFGSFMNPASAARIGLIPPELESRVVAVGNAAGEGARMVALSKSEWKRAGKLGRTAQYLDLAADPDFHDCFVDEMWFPEKSNRVSVLL
jgi:uncharacterized 2Fe-2S/4Fe-4S cluster protein (DUF4445 family)